MTDLFGLFMPLAHPSALERRRERTASYVEGSWSPMLDGVTGKTARESDTCLLMRNTATDRGEPFSLKRGLNGIWHFSSWASPSDCQSLICLQKQRRRPIRSPCTCGGVARWSSGRTSRAGRMHWRTVASGRSNAGRACLPGPSPAWRGNSVCST
jgi:hypothetical protein